MINRERHEHYFKPVSEIYPEAISQQRNMPPSLKMPWWPKFNEYTGGFRPHEFTILCGATGAGKTTLLANISAQLVEQEEKHAVMSVETGPYDFALRVVSAMSGLDINRGESVTDKLYADATTAVGEKLSKDVLEIGLYENRVSLDDLIYHIQCASDSGAKLVMLDNLNFFMEVVRASDSIIEMDRVVHELIMLVKKLPIHVIMVMHPKKTEHGRVESEFDVKGSSTAVQESQQVFLFNRMPRGDLESDPVMKYRRELKFAKMRRRGEFVGNSIVFESKQTQYSEYSVRT